jgi:FkbM family methyltransferase
MSSLKRNVLKSFVHLLGTGLRLAGDMGIQISSALAEELTPVITAKTKNGVLHFFCPGRLPVFRAETLLTKEPETIEWIDRFEENSVFWDIGANVGVYSLYAGLKKGVEVLAFEPATPNLYVLNKNIEINQLDNKILAFGIAFNDVTQLDYFYMSNTEIGSALHSFSQATDWKGESFSPKFKQGMVGFTIDEFVERFDPKFPNHIKIDVDGIEGKIIEGGCKTFEDSRLKSILVELDENQPDITRPAISTIEQAGLKLSAKKPVSMFEGSQFASVYNYFFCRS